LPKYSKSFFFILYFASPKEGGVASHPIHTSPSSKSLVHSKGVKSPKRQSLLQDCKKLLICKSRQKNLYVGNFYKRDMFGNP